MTTVAKSLCTSASRGEDPGQEDGNQGSSGDSQWRPACLQRDCLNQLVSVAFETVSLCSNRRYMVCTTTMLRTVEESRPKRMTTASHQHPAGLAGVVTAHRF